MIKNDDIAISLKNVSKHFNLPHERRDTLKSVFVNIFRPRTTYEKQLVLDDVSFEIKKGEFFGIVGRNGSGKSTLLKILAEIYKPNLGSVTLNGTLTSFIELGIGFNPELTGRENVYLNGAILGLTRKQVNDHYDDIVKFAELENFMDQKLKNYSSGMQVRLAFSIAIQAHNDILLIDEVLAVGDADFQKKCANIFREIKNSDKTVVFVSHDMGAVKEYCDRAILLEKGKIISFGETNKVANDYTQLFNKDANQVTNEINENRWGDMKAVISDIELDVTENFIGLNYTVTAKKATVKEAILGVTIMNLNNNHVFETNTKWKQMDIPILKRGESVTAHFKIPNVLQTGTYSVSVAVAYDEGRSFHDSQEKAIYFDVSRNDATAGMLVLNDSIELR